MKTVSKAQVMRYFFVNGSNGMDDLEKEFISKLTVSDQEQAPYGNRVYFTISHEPNQIKTLNNLDKVIYLYPYLFISI